MKTIKLTPFIGPIMPPKLAYSITTQADTQQLKSKKTHHRTEPKTGRNAKCPCGSGKKYKKCCLTNNTIKGR